MFTSDFDYNLPVKNIAQAPAEPRDSSRLMVINKEEKTVEHKKFTDILDYLQPGDLVVWNNSKVFKARLKGEIKLDQRSDNLKDRKSTNKILNLKPVEVFLLRPSENEGIWKVLAKPGKRLRLGMKIVFATDFVAEVLLKDTDGTVLVDFNDSDFNVRAKANKYGEVPTPPYIKNINITQGELTNKYQTVYAKNEGSVAAPTAGFHFTSQLIEKIKAKGVEFAEVTLHVGLGTFQPVKTERLENHKMHHEWVEITDKNAGLINDAKAQGRRVIAVGTTTVRTLEGLAEINKNNKDNRLIKSFQGDINLFIIPGFKFQVVDALITNFHLPKSTLLMLVSAFAGDRDFMLKCYEEAVKEDYRFFSFGDAMLLH